MNKQSQGGAVKLEMNGKSSQCKLHIVTVSTICFLYPVISETSCTE